MHLLVTMHCNELGAFLSLLKVPLRTCTARIAICQPTCCKRLLLFALSRVSTVSGRAHDGCCDWAEWQRACLCVHDGGGLSRWSCCSRSAKRQGHGSGSTNCCWCCAHGKLTACCLPTLCSRCVQSPGLLHLQSWT